MSIPPEFLERFDRIVPEKQRQIVETAFNATPQFITIRINTLLISVTEACAALDSMNIAWIRSGICDEIICLQNVSMESIRDEDLIRNGSLYPQKMASVIPVLELDPQPGERIMDLCAAPGGKTGHIAARMQNNGFLFVVEPIRDRFFKLMANCERMGVKNAIFKQIDGRMIRPDREGFDKVLVDAPCSSESRFEKDKPKSYAYWSLRKIKEMRKKQIGLIRSGLRCLKPGGTLVYSTCTFAPEENEGVIQYIQRKFKDEIEFLSLNVARKFQYPTLKEWEGKELFESNKSVIPPVILSGSEGSQTLSRDPSTSLRSAQDDRSKKSQDDRSKKSQDDRSKKYQDDKSKKSRDDRSKKSQDDKHLPPVILSGSEESENLSQETQPIGMARYAFPQDGSAFFVAKLKKIS